MPGGRVRGTNSGGFGRFAGVGKPGFLGAVLGLQITVSGPLRQNDTFAARAFFPGTKLEAEEDRFVRACSTWASFVGNQRSMVCAGKFSVRGLFSLLDTLFC
jgi:hypothetical protein